MSSVIRSNTCFEQSIAFVIAVTTLVFLAAYWAQYYVLRVQIVFAVSGKAEASSLTEASSYTAAMLQQMYIYGLDFILAETYQIWLLGCFCVIL